MIICDVCGTQGELFVDFQICDYCERLICSICDDGECSECDNGKSGDYMDLSREG